ncbi:MAG: hypothetical protein U0R69_16060 [Gaiellales bacterium]
MAVAVTSSGALIGRASSFAIDSALVWRRATALVVLLGKDGRAWGQTFRCKV